MNLQPDSDQLMARKVSFVILIASILFILYATLFPFDFVWNRMRSFQDIFQKFNWNLVETFLLNDVPGNILLFIPFGFGATGSAHGNRFRIHGTLLAILMGVLLSLFVEILQISTYSRFPAFMDVLANTAGAFIGALLFTTQGLSWMRKGMFVSKKLSHRISIKSVTGIAVLWIVMCTILLILFRDGFKLANWNPEFPLLLGNEQSGDRAWNGALTDISFLDRALSEDEVETYFLGNDISENGEASPLAFYKFEGDRALVDRTGNLPDFSYKGSASLVTDHQGVVLGNDHWLETPAGLLVDRIRSSSRFTLVAGIQASQTFQTGPARIVSISKDAYHRNFTLGQEGNDLVMRINTPATGVNGRNPEMIIPDVFTNSTKHRLILIYQPYQIKVYIDNAESLYQFRLSPPLALSWKLFPKKDYQVQMVPISPFLINISYYFMMFIPLIMILMVHLNRKYSTSRILN